MQQSTKHKLLVATIAVLVAGVTVTLAIGLRLNPNSQASPLIGKAALPMAVQLLAGGENLSQPPTGPTIPWQELQGKALVVNFWASWCVSCRQEAREMEAFWQSFRQDGGLVVGVAVQDEPEAALAFAKEFGKTYVLGLDDTGNASVDYGVVGVPETFIIDKRGVIRFKHAGPVSAQVLRDEVSRL